MKKIFIVIALITFSMGLSAQDLAEVRELKRLWKYDEAVTLLSEMIDKQGPQVLLLEELADCHYQSGNAAEALELYADLSGEHPDNLTYKIRRMSLLHRAKDYKAAIGVGREILQRDSITQVLSLMGDAYNLRGHRDSAELCYRAALRRRPDGESLVSKLSDLLLTDERYDDVLSVTDAFLRRHPDSRVILPVNGLALYGKGLYQMAAPVFNRLLSLGEDTYAVHYYLGQCYYKQSFLQPAEREFKAAWQRDSSDVGVALTLGRITGGARRPGREYVRWFETALQMLAPDPQTLYTTGVAHQYYALAAYDAGDFDQAVREYTRMLEYSPKHYSAYNMIAQCYENKKDYKNALSWFKKAQNAFAEGSRGREIADAGVERMTQELFMQQ